VPDFVGEASTCAGRKRGEHLEFKPSLNNVYGNYYALGYRFKNAGDDAAVLWTVWKKQGGEWRIVSYAVITP
jgi:hypothetical protein